MIQRLLLLNQWQLPNHHPTTKVIITKPSTNQIVLRTGVVVDKDLNLVVIQTQKVVNVLQQFLRWIGVVKTEKVEYIIWNSPNTEVRQGLGSRTSKIF